MKSMLKVFSVMLAGAAANAAFAASVPTENYSWKNVTISGGGFVTGLVFHPKTPNLLYARTDVGGAYRWNEAGGFWVPLNDDIGGLNNEFMGLGVLSLALDPVNDQRVYLATGQYLDWWAPQGAILASSDRGATWTKTTLPFKLAGNRNGRATGERLQVDPNQPRILYIGSSDAGLWRSADNARTWSKVSTFPEASTTFVLFDKSSSTYGRPSRTIYVGTKPAVAGNPSLYRSIDGGATWQAVPGQPLGGLIALQGAMGYKTQPLLFITLGNSVDPNATGKGAAWKFNTVTGAWGNISPPTGQGGFCGLSVGADNPDVLAISTVTRWYPGDEVYRSIDGGVTWKGALNSLGVLNNSAAPWSVSKGPHWTCDVEIDPFNPDRALVVTGYGIWMTKDFSRATAGKSVHWEFENEEFEETVPHALASPKAGPFHLVSGLADIGGFRHRYLRGTPPLSDYFAPHRNTTSCIAVAELDSTKMVRTLPASPSGQYTVDSGATWTYFPALPPGASGSNPGYIDISADGSRMVWLMGNTQAYYSSNNGMSWTASLGGPVTGTGSFRPVADKVNPNKFYIHNQGAGLVWRSEDGGATFVVAASGLPTSASGLISVPGYEGHLWLISGNGLYQSTDSGASFSLIDTVQEGYALGLGKAAPTQSYPALYSWARIDGVVGFFRSDDAGAHWTRINDSKHQFGAIRQLIGDPRVYGRVFLATSGRGIIYGQPDGVVSNDEQPDYSDPVYSVPVQSVIYDDLNPSPWNSDGWGYSTYKKDNLSPVHGGTKSNQIVFNASWGVVRFLRSGFSVGNYKNLTFWVHGGTTGGQGLTITARLVGDVALSATAYKVPQSMLQPNAWTQVSIPLATLGLKTSDDLIGFTLSPYGFSGSSMPAFYLDDMVIE